MELSQRVKYEDAILDKTLDLAVQDVVRRNAKYPPSQEDISEEFLERLYYWQNRHVKELAESYSTVTDNI